MTSKSERRRLATERRLTETGSFEDQAQKLTLLKNVCSPAEFRKILRQCAYAIVKPPSPSGWKRAKMIEAQLNQERVEKRETRRKILGNQSVYVIGTAGQPIKIGIARDPEQRLRDHQVSYPFKLRLYFAIEIDGDARAVERECHKRAGQFRLNGEWFDMMPDEAIALVKSVIARMEGAIDPVDA